VQRIHSVADLHAALAGARSSVLVPTMGNLHEGHLQLVRHAGSLGAPVVVSVFVNRLQFGVGEDFDRYPRTLDDDATALAGAGCDILFAPDERELYPHPQQILIQPPPEADQLCGAHRAGHFAGVLTVVNKLFNLVQPAAAVFGEKDFQQLFLIKQLVNQLKLPIEIISAPTIREKNGLAISSRNIRLDKSGEKISDVIYKALTQPTIDQMISEISTEPGFKLDYLEVIDELTFEKAKPETQNKRVIIAGWVNDLRLIDNMPMGIRK